MTLFWIGFLCGTVATAYFYPTLRNALRKYGV